MQPSEEDQHSFAGSYRKADLLHPSEGQNKIPADMLATGSIKHNQDMFSPKPEKQRKYFILLVSWSHP